MNSSNDNIPVNDKAIASHADAPTDAGLEALLGAAEPREPPPIEDEKAIRDALKSEWLAMTARRRTRKVSGLFAVAAALILAVVLLIQPRDPGLVSPGPIAGTVTVGSSRVLVNKSDRLPSLTSGAPIHSGMVLSTGAAEGLGIEWLSGESIRVATNSEVSITSANTVFVSNGAIYVDAPPNTVAGSLRITTSHGEVEHIGTQFLVRTSRDTLSVLVREGTVRISLGDNVALVEQGHVATSTESGITEPQRANWIAADWQWAEELSPTIELDGRNMEYLSRLVERETGLPITFTSEEAAEQMKAVVVAGQFNKPAIEVLKTLLLTTDLVLTRSEQQIVISLPSELT